MVGYFQREAHVLLHQDDGRAGIVGDPADDRHQRFHHDGCKPHAHLVDQKDPRALDQRPGQGQHLLFTAGQHPGLQARALAQRGKEIEHLGDRWTRSLAGSPRDREVLGRGELCEQRAVVEHEHDACSVEAPRRTSADELTVNGDRAPDRRQKAGECQQQRGLAGAVGPEHGDHLSSLDVERDVARDRDPLVPDRHFTAQRGGHNDATGSA